MHVASLPRLLFTLGFAACALPALGNEKECSPAAFEKAAGGIAAPRDVLQAAIDGNDLDPEISQRTSDAVVAIKSRLTALVDAQVACIAPGAKPDTAALATTLNSAVAGEKNAEEALLHIEPTLADDKLSVVATIGVPCGSDALWLVYEKRDERWHRVLRWTSPPYRRVDKAWGSFQFAVSPHDADGRWFAIASHIRQWCTSSWSVVDYAVLRPSGETPAVVLQGDDSMWWGGDDIGRLSADATHAELRFHGSSVDTGVHNREYVRRWEISGSTAKRVAPVASSARDFVEEWIVSPWAQAKNWSKQPASLEAAHSRLSAERARHGSVEFGPVMTCASDDTQIELRHEDDSATYFRVAGNDSDYAMTRVDDTPEPDCTKELPAETPAD